MAHVSVTALPLSFLFAVLPSSHAVSFFLARHANTVKNNIGSDKRSLISHHLSGKKPNPAGWFGDFSEAESTYTTEGLDDKKEDPTWSVKYGADPSVESPFVDPEVLTAEWFHESMSAGPATAWQTHFPSVTGSIAGNRNAKENHWRQTPDGWVQDYRPMPSQVGVLHSGPSWFDNSIQQLDGFGRQLTPTSGDGQYYINGWQERSVNATVTCKDPGCTASSSLQLFDVATEEATLCSLSINVHATDYDEDRSRENIEFWKVNGLIATLQCSPGARGCNATTQAPLYPCVNSLNVDKIVSSKGTIVVEGKNTKFVDECPYQGNLLSAVAMASCMVRPKTTTTTTPSVSMLDLFGEAVLKCRDPGCTAETMVPINTKIAKEGGKCTMNVTFQQTDFDDKLGVPEQIDFLSVEGTNMTTAPLQPGKNPCTETFKGKNITDADKTFAAVKNFDVTKLLQTNGLGAVRVRGKISEQVDECAFDDNLLYATVTVACKPAA